MKRLLILFFLLAIISKVYSKQVLFGSDNGNFFFRRDYHEQVKIITSEDFFQNVINKKDEDKFVKRVLKSSKMNQRHEVYEQFYNGIKVEGSGFVLHFVNDSLVSAHAQGSEPETFKIQLK